MSLTASHLDALLAAGITAEQLVALFKADLAERDTVTARRRERDRERQRRHRESRDVTVTNGDVTERVSLDKETSPRPPKEINPIPCVTGRARRKHPLPANWTPAPLKPNGEAGKIISRKPEGWMERQLSKFKDHALQNNRLCSDWDAAWRNWIKQADEYDERRSNTLGRNQPADGLSSTARAAIQVFGR